MNRAFCNVPLLLIFIAKQRTVAIAKVSPEVVLHSLSTGGQLAETDRPGKT